jgi:hypothetical protein
MVSDPKQQPTEEIKKSATHGCSIVPKGNALDWKKFVIHGYNVYLNSYCHNTPSYL